MLLQEHPRKMMNLTEGVNLRPQGRSSQGRSSRLYPPEIPGTKKLGGKGERVMGLNTTKIHIIYM